MTNSNLIAPIYAQAYPWNNTLHGLVESIVLTILDRSDEDEVSLNAHILFCPHTYYSACKNTILSAHNMNLLATIVFLV
jgi:hypothetical protein